ncbi:thioredoxin-like protein [Neoconidiobolus thromboides FSU 785]|nr:thioredoxin-like protein [Neoconidiobolus thromboides FSU 785]
MKFHLLFSLILILCLGLISSASTDKNSDNTETAKDYNFSSVIELTDSTFYEAINSNSEWLIAFTASWCKACNNLKPEYERLATLVNNKLPKVKIGRIDVDTNPAIVNQFVILRLPTIYHIKGNEVRAVEINRDFESLKKFLIYNEWKEIQPFSGLLAPFSIIPIATYTVIFYFNQLVQYAKTLPTWAVSFIPVMLIGFALYHISKSTPDTTPQPQRPTTAKKNK